MAEAPEWLLVMRAMNGLTETPGSGGQSENPRHARRDRARPIPTWRAIARSITHDATPWCGLAVAYCMTMAGDPPGVRHDRHRPLAVGAGLGR